MYQEKECTCCHETLPPEFNGIGAPTPGSQRNNHVYEFVNSEIRALETKLVRLVKVRDALQYQYLPDEVQDYFIDAMVVRPF